MMIKKEEPLTDLTDKQPTSEKSDEDQLIFLN